MQSHKYQIKTNETRECRSRATNQERLKKYHNNTHTNTHTLRTFLITVIWKGFYKQSTVIPLLYVKL